MFHLKLDICFDLESSETFWSASVLKWIRILLKWSKIQVQLCFIFQIDTIMNNIFQVLRFNTNYSNFILIIWSSPVHHHHSNIQAAASKLWINRQVYLNMENKEKFKYLSLISNGKLNLILEWKHSIFTKCSMHPCDWMIF